MKAAFMDGVRRAFDVTLSGLLLLLIGPLLLLLALLVRLSSPGPALFRQQRVGRNGRLFWLLKFRSMRVGDNGPAITAGGDTRITPLGRRLRHWKLDELPQLFNVLRGDMALVGPRPEAPKYVLHYTDEQRQVLSVRPGITGVSQLKFRHEETLLAGRDDVEAFYISTILPAKLELDLQYVHGRTPGGDLLLLCRTAIVIFRRSPEVQTDPANAL